MSDEKQAVKISSPVLIVRTNVPSESYMTTKVEFTNVGVQFITTEGEELIVEYKNMSTILSYSPPVESKDPAIESVFRHPLGVRARDIVTGYEGILTYRVEFLTGCPHYGIQPPWNIEKGEEGMLKERQFDEPRIQVLDNEPIELTTPKKELKIKPGGPNTFVSKQS